MQDLHRVAMARVIVVMIGALKFQNSHVGILIALARDPNGNGDQEDDESLDSECENPDLVGDRSFAAPANVVFDE